jgi:hypothetical protein
MMKKTPEKLWDRDGTAWLVEIKVGTVWVEHSREKTWDNAVSKTEEANEIDGVCGARIAEIVTKQTCSIVYELEKDEIISLPSKMKPTGLMEECVICKAISVVVNDGTTDWVVCSKCKRTIPARGING